MIKLPSYQYSVVIGLLSGVDLKERFCRYYNIKHLNSNYCMPICRAFLKHGQPKFRLEILEYCNPEDRFNRENYYFNLLKPSYNIVKVANSMPSRLGYKHTDETKAKISTSQPNRVEVEVLDLETGIKTIYVSLNAAAKALSCDGTSIKQNIDSKKQKPFKGRYVFKILPKSPISLQIDKKKEPNRVEVEVLDFETNITSNYVSIRAAARALNIEHSTIRKYLKLNIPYQGRYMFKKI